MTLLKSLLNAPMYPKRSLYSGWLEFLKFPTLCKLWELFSLQNPRCFHSQTSFVRFHPTKAEVDIQPKIQGEPHTSSWALSFCTVPASLGLCSVNFSHFKAFLTAKLCLFSSVRSLGSDWFPFLMLQSGNCLQA